MSYHPRVSGCGRIWCLRTITIAASRAWAFSMLRKLSWMVHVLLVGTWPSRSCVIDSYVKHGGVPLPRSGVRPGTQGATASGGVKKQKQKKQVIWGLRWGLPQVEFLTPQALHSRRGCHRIRLGPLQSGVHPLFPSVLPLTTRHWSLHGG